MLWALHLILCIPLDITPGCDLTEHFPFSEFAHSQYADPTKPLDATTPE